MHSLLKSTTATAALAAAVALSPLPLLAQDASTGGTAGGTTALGTTAQGTGGTTLAQEGTTAQGTDTGTTELAQDNALTGDADTTVAEDDALTGDADTTVAQDDALTGDPAATGTAVAQDDATTATGTDPITTAQETAGTVTSTEGTATAQGATGTTAADGTETAQDATGATATDGTETAQDATGTTAADGTETAQDATATDDAAADTAAAAQAGADAATETAGTQDSAGAAGDVPAQPTAEMAAVLNKHAELGARPVEELSVEEARTQPTPADAVMAVMEEQGIETPAEIAAIVTRDVTYPAADGSEQAARVYTPEGEGPFPLIVYYHGGGWVIADIDTYDASARALSAGADAVVISVEYRHAPEAPFPAAHDDANAAFTYFVENSGEFNADSERLAVAGESAGGNLAANVAIYARDAQLTPIDHMLLVYPVAGNDMETASYQTNAEARPLSRASMMWFVEHVFEDPSQTSDPRLNLVGRDDLAGLPPATIINAEIDPLTTEGVTLGSLLEEAGVEVSQMTYPGVTHEFFGMGAVVPTAKEAEDMAVANLRAAFGGEAGGATATVEATPETVTDVQSTAAPAADAATDDAAATGDAAAEGTAEPVEGDAATGTAN